MKRASTFWSLAVLCVGCSGAPTSAPGPVAQAERVARNKMISLSEVRSPSPLRREGGGVAAEGAVHAVRVAEDGSWSYRPLRARGRQGVVDATPLTLGSSSIERGDARSSRGHLRNGDHDRQLAFDRGLAVERLNWGEQAIEQTWTFAAPPVDSRSPSASSGGALPPVDLVVKVPVSGHDFLDEDSEGLRFRDPKSGAVVRYGVATFVDAAGERTTVLPRFQDGTIVITVPASVVDGARYPAVLDPRVSADLELDNPPVIPGSAVTDSVAYDPLHSQYLATWRNGGNIYAQRLTYAGGTSVPATVGSEILVASKPVGGTGQELTGSSVFFDGTNYEIVWSGDAGTVSGLWERRLNSSGTWVDGSAISIDATATESIATARTKLGVAVAVYWRTPLAGAISLQPINSSGAVGSALSIGSGYWPSVGSDGSGFLIAAHGNEWAPHGNVTPYLVNSALTTVTPLPVVTTEGVNSSITFAAGQYLLLWEDEVVRGPGLTDLMGIFVTGGVESSVFGVDAGGPGAHRQPFGTFDGKNFIVGETYANSLYMMQLTPGSAPPTLTTPTLVAGTSSSTPKGASNGFGEVVWTVAIWDGTNTEAFTGGWASGVNGAPCTVGADCDAGHCIINSPAGTGGTCCAVACPSDSCNIGVCVGGTTCVTHTVSSGICGAYSSCQGQAAGCSAPVDSDGDNLPDVWENSNNGLGQHYVDVNCDGAWQSSEPLLAGASAGTPDVFVTYDYMGLGLDDWSCSTAADCTALGGAHRGEACVGGKCVYQCQTNTDCTDGTHNACSGNADCAAGSYCDTVNTHQCQRGVWHAAEKCLLNNSVTVVNPSGTTCVGANCGVCYHTHDPEAIAPGAIQKVIDSYSAHGVSLHVTRGVQQPHSHVVSFRPDGSMTPSCEGAGGSNAGIGKYAVSVYDLKSVALPANTNEFMHYGLFGHYVGCDTSAHCTPPAMGGSSDCPYATNPDSTPKNVPAQGMTGLAEISGNDFVVSLGGAVNDSAFNPTVLSPAGYSLVGAAFMHELGHNLGLRHDGHVDKPCPLGTGCAPGDVCINLSDGEGQVCHEITAGMTGVEQPNDKPNYVSVMNYRYEPNGIQNSNVLNSAPAGSIWSVGANVADATMTRLDYSNQTLPIGGPTPGALVDNNLSDTAGLGAVVDSHFPGQQLLFTYKDGLCDSAWRTAPATGSVDWETFNVTFGATGQVADVAAPVGVGVCAGAPTATLSGHTDWGNFVYAFQCASTFGDGFAPVANYPSEPDVPSMSGSTRGATCGQVGCLGPTPPLADNPTCGPQGCSSPIVAKVDIRPQAQNNWVVYNDTVQTSGQATVSYTGGYCTVCSGSYACFSNNTSTFTDPTPAGGVTTGVGVQLLGTDCTNGGTLSVYVNGNFIGTTSVADNCACGSCQTYPTVGVYTGFVPLRGWVQGGTNTLTVTTSNGSSTCLHQALITTNYWRTVPVVVYGSPQLDVTQIVPTTVNLGYATPIWTPVTSTDLDGDGYKDLQATYIGAATGLSSTSTSGTITGTVNLPLGGSTPIVGTDVVVMSATNRDTIYCSSAGYSGRGGCWYKGALGSTCNSTCVNHAGFNATTSTHTGNAIGKAFFPLKANGSNWVNIECASTDNNTDWGANGMTADGTWSFGACYPMCSCAN